MYELYTKSYVEIPSPILQSQRHEVTLRKALKAFGYDALQFLHYVLIDYKAKLIKHNNGKFDHVCHPDRLEEVWKKEDDQPVKVVELGLALKGLGRLFTGKSLSIEELQDIGNNIAAMYAPIKQHLRFKI